MCESNFLNFEKWHNFVKNDVLLSKNTSCYVKRFFKFWKMTHVGFKWHIFVKYVVFLQNLLQCLFLFQTNLIDSRPNLITTLISFFRFRLEINLITATRKSLFTGFASAADLRLEYSSWELGKYRIWGLLAGWMADWLIFIDFHWFLWIFIDFHWFS